MKDSQDWLVDITSLYAGYYAGKVTLGELYDGVDGIVRKHILQEALEMIGEDEEEKWFNKNLVEKGNEYERSFLVDEMPVRNRNQLRQELRNKFNDKYKED